MVSVCELYVCMFWKEKNLNTFTHWRLLLFTGFKAHNINMYLLFSTVIAILFNNISGRITCPVNTTHINGVEEDKDN